MESKIKRIELKFSINHWYQIPLSFEDASKIGLQYVFGTHGTIYDVIDEPLFMLEVIKYGLNFVEIVEKKK